ncbi:MAG: AraC family ligand binding domain-containing protein, partial [Bacteroidota bacterium]
MQVIEAYKPFEIQEIELDRWTERPVKNNFFELVLVREGVGTQCINYNDYPYEANSLFLLPPLKCHSFQIEERSRFVFLKFTSDFFQAHAGGETDHTQWFKDAACMLSTYNQLPGDIIHSELDRQHICTLVELILKENQQYSLSSAALIKSLMISVLEVLMRNIKQSDLQFGTQENVQ